jgi:hypothetical protein
MRDARFVAAYPTVIAIRRNESRWRQAAKLVPQ